MSYEAFGVHTQPGPSAHATNMRPPWRGRGRGRGRRRRGRGSGSRGGGNSNIGGVPSATLPSENAAQKVPPAQVEAVNDCLENEGAEPLQQNTPSEDIMYIDTGPPSTSLSSSQGNETGDDQSQQTSNKRPREEDASVEAGSEDEEKEVGQQWKRARLPMEYQPQLSREKLREASYEYLKQDSKGCYYCILCYAQLNRDITLEKHISNSEHARRVNAMLDEEVQALPFHCKVCTTTCTTKESYNAHLKGKKHAKTVAATKKINSIPDLMPVDIYKLEMDRIMERNVLKEGTGLQLGLSTGMQEFFKFREPLIGLQYAVEEGHEDDPNPLYHCTLCNVMTEAKNKMVHFCSVNHRYNVLKQDYPDRHKKLTEQPMERKELTDELKKVAQEIENWEGRKVELVTRRILERPPPAVKGEPSSRKKRGRGSGASQRGRGKGSLRPGRGSGSSNRGSGQGKRGRGMVPIQRGRGHGNRPQRGGLSFSSRGRGWPGEQGYGRHLPPDDRIDYLSSDLRYNGPLSRRGRFSDSGLDWKPPRFRYEEEEERWFEPTLSPRRSRPGLLHPHEPRIPFPEELPPSNPYRQPRRLPSQTSPPPSDYKPFSSDWQTESRWKTPPSSLPDDPWHRRMDSLGSSSSHRLHDSRFPDSRFPDNPFRDNPFRDNPFRDKLPFESFSREPRRSEPGPSRSYSSRREEMQRGDSEGPLQTLLQALGRGTDDKDALQNAVAQMVQSETDADVALKLSSALTQALLGYRLHNTANILGGDNPLGEALQGLMDSGLAGNPRR